MPMGKMAQSEAATEANWMNSVNVWAETTQSTKEGMVLMTQTGLIVTKHESKTSDFVLLNNFWQKWPIEILWNVHQRRLRHILLATITADGVADAPPGRSIQILLNSLSAKLLFQLKQMMVSYYETPSVNIS